MRTRDRIRELKKAIGKQVLMQPFVDGGKVKVAIRCFDGACKPVDDEVLDDGYELDSVMWDLLPTQNFE